MFGQSYKLQNTPLEESIIQAWTSEPHGRNINVVNRHTGLEISGCTFNARIYPLSKVLGSDPMKWYLADTLRDWRGTQLEQMYFEALNSEDNSFVNFFRNRLRNSNTTSARQSHSLSMSSNILSKHPSRSFGMLERGLHGLLEFPGQEPAWSGFLADTAASCAFLIITPQCLQLDGIRQISSRQHVIDMADEGDRVLETVIYINERAKIPPKLHRSGSGHEWITCHLRDGGVFDVGESGRLVV